MDRRLFVGGISFDTTEDDIRNYFNVFGQVLEANIMRDPASRRSRCFAFVTFAETSAANKAILQSEHKLNGRNVDVKAAVPARKSDGNKTFSGNNSTSGNTNSENSQPSESNFSAGNNGPSSQSVSGSSVAARLGKIPTPGKIFVGGLHYDTCSDSLREYFEQFGPIESVQVMYNRETGKSRGFGFITFVDISAVDSASAKKMHTIDCKAVEVKRAVPRAERTAPRTGANDTNFNGAKSVGPGNTVVPEVVSQTSDGKAGLRRRPNPAQTRNVWGTGRTTRQVNGAMSFADVAKASVAPPAMNSPPIMPVVPQMGAPVPPPSLMPQASGGAYPPMLMNNMQNTGWPNSVSSMPINNLQQMPMVDMNGNHLTLPLGGMNMLNGLGGFAGNDENHLNSGFANQQNNSTDSNTNFINNNSNSNVAWGNTNQDQQSFLHPEMHMPGLAAAMGLNFVDMDATLGLGVQKKNQQVSEGGDGSNGNNVKSNSSQSQLSKDLKGDSTTPQKDTMPDISSLNMNSFQYANPNQTQSYMPVNNQGNFILPPNVGFSDSIGGLSNTWNSGIDQSKLGGPLGGSGLNSSSDRNALGNGGNTSSVNKLGWNQPPGYAIPSLPRVSPYEYNSYNQQLPMMAAMPNWGAAGVQQQSVGLPSNNGNAVASSSNGFAVGRDGTLNKNPAQH
eukprot:GSMAST32.ASY1.ANO1.1812.1 assembled CDS